jgi:molybdenum cofactor guanylyltransferase
MQAAGFVLVGGQSSRMGQDKARLRVRERLLVEGVAAKVKEAAGSVTLVGSPERYSDLSFECLPDLRRGLGPLAGLEAALSSRRADINLVLACDMPEVKADHLRRLLFEVGRSDASCVVTRDLTSTVHPLCAVYRSRCLDSVSRALDARRLRLLDIVRELHATVVDIAATIPNLNTPEQFAQWLQARREANASRSRA